MSASTTWRGSSASPWCCPSSSDFSAGRRGSPPGRWILTGGAPPPPAVPHILPQDRLDDLLDLERLAQGRKIVRLAARHRRDLVELAAEDERPSLVRRER